MGSRSSSDTLLFLKEIKISMMKSRAGGGAEDEQRQLVIVPLPSHGHYISTLEFAHRLIIAADQRFSVTILRVRSSLDPHPRIYTKSQQTTHDLIRFIDLPPVDPPPLHLAQKSIEHYTLLFFESLVPHVKHAITHHLLASSDDSPPLAALLLDIFSLPMVHIAKDLGLPSYLYSATGNAFLGLLLYLPSHHARVGTEFDQDSDLDLDLPGFLHPVPPRVLPEAASNKHGGYAAFVKLAQLLRETEGIIVNTFAELEPPLAVQSLAVDGQTPPVYTVGPVLDVGGQAHPGSDGADHDRIMAWLDAQPESSVVFVCFGSWGSIGEAQVREIAIGLERSGHRFLWALRLRGPEGKFDGSEASAEILPEGLLDRTGERGMVCGWAPQMEVLSHRATGGFVSHCGWNSILESIWNGVPIATWPLYAEQQLNAFRLVKELGLAVELRLDYRQERGDVVTAEEIEVAVKGLMEEGGDSSPVRKKVKEMGEMSRKALMEGGSSSISLNRLIDDILAHRRQPPESLHK